MLARIWRDDQAARGMLSDAVGESLKANSEVYGRLFQVSNPCWYRYEVVSLSSTTPTTTTARVRVYQHFWGGDNAGEIPRSWEQEVGLTQTAVGWRVDRIGFFENWRDEPNEPHGPTTSACNVARQPRD